MYCVQCGTNNEPGADFCVQCGARLNAVPVPQTPAVTTPATIPNYMVQSILVTLCCCLPIGIACILKANKVDRLLAAHDYQGAMQASEENKKLLWIGFAAGVVVGILYFIGEMAKQH